MFKVALLTLALCSVVLAETSFEVAPLYARAISLPKPGDEISYPTPVKAAGTFAIPPDNGSGNYGDNLWKNRVAGDVLLTREVQINGIASSEQSFNWNGNFPGKSITHIRFFNVGRQRAWVQSITANGGSTASAKILVAPNNQFRLMIEVYGK